jgi:hypothetical protein
MFIGSFLFEFVGVLFKWLFQFPLSIIKHSKIRSFKVIWNGEDKEPNDIFLHGISNIFLGVIIIAMFIYLALWLNW